MRTRGKEKTRGKIIKRVGIEAYQVQDHFCIDVLSLTILPYTFLTPI